MQPDGAPSLLQQEQRQGRPLEWKEGSTLQQRASLSFLALVTRQLSSEMHRTPMHPSIYPCFPSYLTPCLTNCSSKQQPPSYVAAPSRLAWLA
jgi:hypothetical protein